jgi:hypothetical protein
MYLQLGLSIEDLVSFVIQTLPLPLHHIPKPHIVHLAGVLMIMFRVQHN